MPSSTFARFAPARPMPEGGARTKIVATIGPASEDLVEELVDAGMSVARINFSHGTEEEHRSQNGNGNWSTTSCARSCWAVTIVPSHSTT